MTHSVPPMLRDLAEEGTGRLQEPVAREDQNKVESSGHDRTAVLMRQPAEAGDQPGSIPWVQEEPLTVGALCLCEKQYADGTIFPEAPPLNGLQVGDRKVSFFKDMAPDKSIILRWVHDQGPWPLAPMRTWEAQILFCG